MTPTPNEQVLIVLEWMGWKQDVHGLWHWNTVPERHGLLTKELPNLLNDLNAIHEAWNGLDRKQRITCSQELRIIVVNAGGHASSFKEDVDACCENTKAPKRLEALARTIKPEAFV